MWGELGSFFWFLLNVVRYASKEVCAWLCIIRCPLQPKLRKHKRVQLARAKIIWSTVPEYRRLVRKTVVRVRFYEHWSCTMQDIVYKNIRRRIKPPSTWAWQHILANKNNKKGVSSLARISGAVEMLVARLSFVTGESFSAGGKIRPRERPGNIILKSVQHLCNVWNCERLVTVRSMEAAWWCLCCVLFFLCCVGKVFPNPLSQALRARFVE